MNVLRQYCILLCALMAVIGSTALSHAAGPPALSDNATVVLTIDNWCSVNIVSDTITINANHGPDTYSATSDVVVQKNYNGNPAPSANTNVTAGVSGLDDLSPEVALTFTGYTPGSTVALPRGTFNGTVSVTIHTGWEDAAGTKSGTVTVTVQG